MAKIVIDEERCKGCELCIPACPKHIIVMSEKYNKRVIVLLNRLTLKNVPDVLFVP